MAPWVPYFWCRSMRSGVTPGVTDSAPLHTCSWSVCELKKGAWAAECTLQVPVKSTAHGEVVDSKCEAPLYTVGPFYLWKLVKAAGPSTTKHVLPTNAGAACTSCDGMP